MLPHGELTEIGEKGINLSGKHWLCVAYSRVRLIRYISGGQKVVLSHVNVNMVTDPLCHAGSRFVGSCSLFRSGYRSS